MHLRIRITPYIMFVYQSPTRKKQITKTNNAHITTPWRQTQNVVTQKHARTLSHTRPHADSSLSKWTYDVLRSVISVYLTRGRCFPLKKYWTVYAKPVYHYQRDSLARASGSGGSVRAVSVTYLRVRQVGLRFPGAKFSRNNTFIHKSGDFGWLSIVDCASRVIVGEKRFRVSRC